MISKEFLENVESGDLMTVRSALLDDLIVDRTFRTFDEEFNVANQRLSILVPYDGEPFETDAGKWDKEYLNQQKVALMVNFSEERIAHLKAVIAKVMPPVPRESSKKTNKSETDGVGTALIIGGAAVAAVGVAIAEPVVIGAGVVAVGAGVCIKVNNRR